MVKTQGSKEVTKSIILTPTTEPTNATEGEIYYDSSSGFKIRGASSFAGVGTSEAHTLYTGTDLNAGFFNNGNTSQSSVKTKTFTIEAADLNKYVRIIVTMHSDFQMVGTGSTYQRGYNSLKIETSVKDADSWTDLLPSTNLLQAYNPPTNEITEAENLTSTEMYYVPVAGEIAAGLDIRVTTTLGDSGDGSNGVSGTYASTLRQLVIYSE